MNRSPSSLRPRKKPVQPRAVETYAWMLEAAAQILEAQSIGAFNTNLVAERIDKLQLGARTPSRDFQ